MIAPKLSLAVVVLTGVLASPLTAAEAPRWSPWSADLFARAKAENRFVILDLEAVWCHWCHVMETKTYGDARVAELLASKYIPVRVDQDANPDLSSRYGDWGWPATIVFAPDGSEIVKRSGYIEPGAMAALLSAIIEDPSPGPSVAPQADAVPSKDAFLTAVQRRDLEKRSRAAFDETNAGWGRAQGAANVRCGT
jgi:hypothetical protein